MDSAAASLLVALPFACFGVFSFTGAALIRRFGASRLIAACLLLLAVGTAARAAMPTALLLILATIPIGVVIALIGVALPGMVKHHFAARGGTTTGFYASSINVGGALAALTIVPIAELVGGWRWAFALSAIPAGMALAVWFRADTDTDLEDTEAPRIRTSRPPSHGVMLGVIFGLQAMVFAGLVTWIAAIYIEAGWSGADAALPGAASPALTLPAALIVNRLSDGRDRRYWVFWAGLTMALGTLLVGLTPTSAAAVWLLVLGIGAGSMLPLMLALPLDMRATPAAVTDLSAWMLGVGYIMAASSPLLVGALRDATGSFAIPVGGMLTAAGVACALLVLTLPKAASLRVG